MKEAGSVFFCRETCEETLKEFEVEEKASGQTYCSLSDGMSYETAKNLMKLPYFKNFINNVITGEVNKSNWSIQDFQSHEDLDSWEDLCQ